MKTEKELQAYGNSELIELIMELQETQKQIKNEVLDKLTDKNALKLMENDGEMYPLLLAYTKAFRDVSKVFTKFKL